MVATAPPSGRMLRSAVERSLPRRAYLDPAHFERERDAIFQREWFAVGRAEAIPARGDFLHLDVAGESVVVVRGGDGALHGHLNLCRHRGSRLTSTDAAPASCERATPTGTFKGVIRCPYHSWIYELDGRVRNAPFLGEGEGFYKEEFGLHPVGVAEWGGFVFVNLSAEPDRRRPETLEVQLGRIRDRLRRYPLAELRQARRLVYDVAANWKVVAENFNECYHCAGVHPELCRIVPAFKERGGANLDWDGGIPHADGAFTFTASGTTDRQPFPGLDAEERRRHKGELAYPNLMLSLSADHVAAFTLWPRDAGHTTIQVDFLFHPGEIERQTFDPSDAVEFWDLVNRQDWAICESVQAGMSSRRFEHGYYAPMEDLALDIRRYLAERLGPEVLA